MWTLTGTSSEQQQQDKELRGRLLTFFLACLLWGDSEGEEEILSRQTSVIAFFESFSRTGALPLVLLDIALDDPDGQLTVQEATAL